MEEKIDGFSTSQTRVFWNSRKRSANGDKVPIVSQTAEDEDTPIPMVMNQQEEDKVEGNHEQESSTPPAISERRKALFEPLDPTIGGGRRSSEELLPPPDFDATCYPKGWLIGKKRKLVNVDVVESMRRIAVQEMNRKDREINGLNEQLEEDARVLEHLQLQLLQERTKCADAEREKSLLQNQVSMLMNMLQDQDADIDDQDDYQDTHDDNGDS
ncbi:hypothetical protein ACHQM5_030715 [Ranunculus cassubicifolius]